MTVARCNRLLGSAGLLDEAGAVRRRGLGRGLRAMHCVLVTASGSFGLGVLVLAVPDAV